MKADGVRAGGSSDAGIAILHTPAEFTRCLGHPAVHRSGAFALHVAPFDDVPADGVPSTAPSVWRLGLVIPKRYEKSAVARNTIKRRWRAAFRLNHVRLSVEFGAADLVVRLQRPLLPKSTAVDLITALKPAKRRARALFDPEATLRALAERMRRSPAAPRPLRPTGS